LLRPVIASITGTAAVRGPLFLPGDIIVKTAFTSPRRTTTIKSVRTPRSPPIRAAIMPPRAAPVKPSTMASTSHSVDTS
jgi:hypothetical protein